LDEGGRVVPGVVAAGDVARWHNELFDEAMRVEHWSNAADQAAAAAATLVHGGGDPHPPFAPVPYFWSDQYGHKLQYLGHSRPGDDVMIVELDEERARFVAVYGRDGRTVAAFTLDWPARLMAWRQKIEDRVPFPPASDTS
jgi:NADPH-dependent 2,4-dienoyl-CoA reductase/sulfur reductase-like enzyme